MKPPVKILNRDKPVLGAEPPVNYAEIGRKDWTKRVRNPIARECILAAYSAFERGDRELYPTVADLPSDLQELFRQLKKSDLARQIAGGIDSLPDIYAEMPEPYRSVERLRVPRSYGDLTRHVLVYLDWYMNTSTRPIPRWSDLFKRLMWMLVSLPVTALGVAAMGHSIAPVFTFLPVCGIIALVLGLAMFSRRPSMDALSSRRAMAFVLYLIDEYGEKEV